MALTGINYPWLNYGWDFGHPPDGWSGGQDVEAFRAAQRATLRADLQALAQAGVTVLRWFLLADGLAYGTGASAPQDDGDFFVLPPGDPWIRQLQADFAATLEVCHETGVQLLPSLIDFHFCFAPTAAAPGVIKGGRAPVLQQDLQRGLFLDTVLDPLLEASAARPSAIYAWEPMNEPEWCTGGSEWRFWERPASANRTISRQDMRAFLKDAVRRINTAGFVSTVGFAHWDTIRDWDAEDWDIGLQQYHYYAQGGAPLPEASAVTAQPCLLGEFASLPAKAWPNGFATLDARLKHIADAGYAGALPWSMRATDDATLWNQEQHLALARHTGRDRAEA